MPINNNGLVTINGRNAITGSNFGYSNGAWKTLVIGSTGTNYNTDGNWFQSIQQVKQQYPKP